MLARHGWSAAPTKISMARCTSSSGDSYTLSNPLHFVLESARNIRKIYIYLLLIPCIFNRLIGINKFAATPLNLRKLG